MTMALVHDWLNQVGGAEDVLEALVELFPQRPIYTSIFWREAMPEAWWEWDIRPSFMDRLPLIHKRQQLYLPLYPLAFEQFDFGQYEWVLSNKSGFCHGIVTGPETMHICYCLSPTRYVWRFHQYAEQENLGRWRRGLLAPFLSWLRQWDRLASDRVDHYIAISQAIRQRIAKVYRRQSTIIYPPVETNLFEPASKTEDYYLFVGRLVPYRRLDILIEAFNQLDRPLLIAGSGRDRERLETLAGPSVQFLGRVDDQERSRLLAGCRAFMFPGEEDFGIAPIQAMAAGRPVIALGAGGALETVIPGRTGALFHEQTAAAIAQAVEGFDDSALSSSAIRAHAEQFDTAVFQRKMRKFVEEKLEEHRYGTSPVREAI